MRKRGCLCFFAAFIVLASAAPVRADDESSATQAAGGDLLEFEKKLAEMRRELDQFKTLKLTDPSTMRVYFRDGVRMETADKKFQFAMTGRIHFDSTFGTVDDELEQFLGGNFEDSTQFRRARIGVGGVVFERFEYKAEYDFAGGGPAFRDVYVGILKLPGVGTFRAGHFREPLGLEELTSSNYISFVERSLTSTFTPARNPGVMVFNTFAEDRVWVGVGGFRDDGGDNFGRSVGDGEYAATARIVALPWMEDDGKQLLHIGTAYSYRSPPGGVVRYRSRPEVGVSPNFVDTGALSVDDNHVAGAEAALVLGSFSAQSEFIYSHVEGRRSSSDSDFWAFYAYVSFFLTGEHRAYDPKTATFTRVRPIANFLESDGSVVPVGGAWELLARYSTVDLDDAEVTGGALHDVTLGLNWYWNPVLKTMFNYVYSTRESIDGDAHLFLVSFRLGL